MKSENGHGSVYQLSGRRRKPWCVRITDEWDKETKQQKRTCLGTFKTKEEAEFFLEDYHNTGEYGSNVYFITDGTFTKVGKANDVGKRLKVLQTASPKTLKIQRVFKCQDAKEAYDLEHFFHTILEDHRVNGEWFNIPISERW